jgi:hypothetical protein
MMNLFIIRLFCAMLLTLLIPSMCDTAIKKGSDGTSMTVKDRLDETVGKKSAKIDRLEDFTTTSQEAEKLKAKWSGKVFSSEI